ncbi:N-terminal acetyltransferase complex subunit [ARD1] [Thermoplasma volcanium GSS1]|uniref:N-terminal acetyltransferase complex subunit [ARD1] n=1 Tax=Thermoplasma volcanium (strain ATCC 51530 / DSM 4299 / JCM 9571 / NBRC 15438 / GSS1) TaxID=273116 RepID=Q979C1_THEVO|nr:ribosomal protein S18-alanine N-acetyltransferase [Thermoplasma volcanium]BAB60382.1 N-terminal acetyltransferase complex subunit [ARD1] [Thermoplasma volcanium GSS1]
MIVRRYLKQDLCAVARLEVRSFEIGPYDKEYLREVLENASSISYIAQISDKIVGYIVAMPLNSQEIDIESIATDPDFRKRSIGTRLIARIENESKSLGYRNIILEVRKENIEAISFYSRLGFNIKEFIVNYYEEYYRGSRDAYRMVKSLS